MRAALAVEMRRSGVRWVVPGIAAISVLLVFSRSGWQWQWLWAADWSAGVTVIITPILAGIVAHVTYHRVRAFGLLVASTTRGVLGVFAAAGVLWLGGVLGWALAVGVALGRAALTSGAGGAEISWALGEAAVVLLAAACFGLMVGTTVRHSLTGPLAAVLVFATSIVLTQAGLDGIFSAGGATAPLFGQRPDPVYYLGRGVLALAICAVCVLIAVARLRPVQKTRISILGAAACAICLLVGGAANWTSDRFLTTTTPPACVGAGVRVCGPSEARALLTVAARDLDVARRVVRDAGLDLQREYAFAGERPTLGPVGVLSVEPSDMGGGHMSTWQLGLTLATPTACPAYWAGAAPEGLVDGQRRIAMWIEEVLAGSVSSADREAARETYEALRACRGDSVPDWDIDQR